MPYFMKMFHFRGNMLNFSGDLVNSWGSFEWPERREQGVLRAIHPCTSFSGECPPPRQGKFLYCVV